MGGSGAYWWGRDYVGCARRDLASSVVSSNGSEGQGEVGGCFACREKKKRMNRRGNCVLGLGHMGWA